MPTKQTSTVTGLSKEATAALSYVMLAFSGLLFLLLEKDPFIRFHAMQSIVFTVAIFILNFLIVTTVVLSFFLPLLFLIEFALWLVLIYKASQGERWELPYIGPFVTKNLPK